MDSISTVVLMCLFWLIVSFLFTLWIGCEDSCGGIEFSKKTFWGLSILGIASFIYLGNGVSYCVVDTKMCLKEVELTKKQAEKVTKNREEFCRGAHIVSSTNGIDLYQTNCRINNGQFVYFSKSGTSTTHEECHHTGRMQKHCEIKQDNTSNN